MPALQEVLDPIICAKPMESAVKMEIRISKLITFNGVPARLCDSATDGPSDKPDLTATTLRRSVRLSSSPRDSSANALSRVSAHWGIFR